MRRFCPILAGLFLSGCGTTFVAPLSDAPNEADLKALNTQIYSNFLSLKMSGTPEVSSLHKNDALGTPAEQAICLRNAGGDNVKYVVFLISQNKIVDFRAAVAMDRCEKQDYRPLPKPEVPKPAKPAKRAPAKPN